MENISYEKFIKLLDSFDLFDEKLLFALYEKYGKDVINYYFDKMSKNMNEQEFMEFSKKYSAYFDNIYDGQLKNDYEVTNLVNHMFYAFGSKDTTIMSSNEETYYGNILNESKVNLNICKNGDGLYPDVDVAKILKSIYCSDYYDENLKLLKDLKSLPYKLSDENIFKKELKYFKQMLKFVDKPSYDEFVKTFDDLKIDGVEISNNISYELILLKKYIIAKNNFFKRNIRLVYFISRYYYKYNKMQFNDIMQDGSLGLIKAINMFDINKGNRFSTYAAYWIKQNILRSLNCTVDMIRKPYKVNVKKLEYNKFINEYYINHSCMPSEEEIIEKLGINKIDLHDFENNYGACSSLEVPIGDSDDNFFVDIIPDKNANIEDEIFNDELTKLINDSINSCLNDREREIIMLRYGLNNNKEHTLEEVGEMYGLTRERIRQIEIKARNKMKANGKRSGLKDFL